MAFSLDDKKIKTLLVVIVVGLVLYLLVSYMHDSKRPHAHIFGDEPNDHNNTVVKDEPVSNGVDENFLSELTEGFDNNNNVENGEEVPEVEAPEAPEAPEVEIVEQDSVQPSEAGANSDYNSVPQGSASGSELPAECYPKDVLSSADLLPTDANSKWAQANPQGQGSLSDKNFLNAGFHVGVNTVGQSLRNANRQLRSDPPNPQVKVSPWMQTTIEPDINRKPMEIGA